ncbi:DUF6286 domain-containing protein [Actinomadura kijaniata]|uniref:DUF6286 domain-containing protein n=1 Tax=Actinomadura kijaniata TaxID=46161 RepID=UPI003F1A60A4
MIDTLVTRRSADTGGTTATTDGAAGEGEPRRARRRARRRAAEEFRSPRAAVGVPTALAVAVTGGAGAVEVLSRLVGRPAGLVPAERLSAVLRQTPWGDPRALAVSGALAALGLALVAAALLGRPRVVAMDGADPSLAAGIARADLRRALVRAALEVPGVARAGVRLHGPFRRRVTVRATSRYRNPGNLAELVRIAVACRLDHLDLARPATVGVRLRRRRD